MLIDYKNFQVQVIFGPALVYQPISALSKSIFYNKAKAAKFPLFFLHCRIQFFDLSDRSRNMFAFIVLKVQAFGNGT